MIDKYGSNLRNELIKSLIKTIPKNNDYKPTRYVAPPVYNNVKSCENKNN